MTATACLDDSFIADAAVNRDVIAEALARLPAEHRAVIRRSQYEGKTIRQIANELRTDEGTVKSWLHHGLRALLAECAPSSRCRRCHCFLSRFAS